VGKILYFAYGSNMLSRRLQHPTRAPSARAIAVGFITGHKLTFDKRSIDCSGKCDAEATGAPDDHVYGVLYQMEETEKSKLDSVESLGYGYDEKYVHVILDTNTVEAVMYYATEKDTSLYPYHWYKEYVVAGAREHGLPADYLSLLEKVKSVKDPDPCRCAKERAILCGS
jgi:gamma-glutamylcyclotransferase